MITPGEETVMGQYLPVGMTNARLRAYCLVRRPRYAQAS